MADSNNKFAEIQEMLNYFEKKWANISDTQMANYKQMRLDVEKSVADSEKRNLEYITERVMEIRKEGIIETSEQEAKLSQKMIDDQKKRKLESEIDILKEISKEEEKKRERELKILELEADVQKKKNTGQDKAAKLSQKDLDKLKREEAISKKKEKQLDREKQLKEEGAGYEFGDTFKELFQPLKDEIAKGNVLKRAADQALTNSMKQMGKAITDGLNQINTAISEYAKYQTSINTRLQGTQGDVVNVYSSLVGKLDDVAFSPLLKAADLYSNLSNLVGQGIVTNVEQRAFFETIKGGIATTFDVTSDSLNRMIRLQHNDSTAARLGMESYLTRFLNVYVENTEYLQSTFDNVASSLLEASAVLGGLSGVDASLEFEYIVQKWLGTLTGAGLSTETAQSIATALGQLGSGNIDVLNTQMGTLLTMSASRIGQNIGDILNKGLNADSTNKLLTSMVEYLKTIAGDGTNVTKAELSKIFGVSISDLVAVAQMDQATINTINKDLLTYGGMYTELRNQFSKLPSRMGIANILENLFDNLTFQTGMSIASNPASFALWKITDLVQSVTGGIPIPFITAFGSGVDLEATVEQLMKLGIVGVSTLGNIGKIIGGLSSIGKGEVLLDKLGISAGSAEVKRFGSGLSLTPTGLRRGGKETSQVAYIGQEEGSAFSQSTISQNKSESEKELDKKLEQQQENDPVVKYLRDDLKLKDSVAALTAIATTSTNSYDVLTKINSSDGSITKAIAQINATLTDRILPAMGKYGSIGFSESIAGTTIIAPLSNGENISVNNMVTTATTVSAPSPVIDYFNSIKFEEGFASIVQNILEINSKIPAAGSSIGGSVVGFTQ